MTQNFANAFVITPDAPFALASIDPRGPDDLPIDKSDADEQLRSGQAALRDLQERLYADGRHALLVVLQGMDTSGKDGIVGHVMSGVNPQGCRVISFKAPSATELRHDFLWRAARALPERGEITIFNRSYYEEVGVVRVHRDFLDKEKLPAECVGEYIWRERFESIRAFEKHLVRNGTTVLKFFLHISKKEQKKRLLARIDEPAKNWKFNSGDLTERAYWDDYALVYDAAIRETTTVEVPWHVVPADRKWLARLIVQDAIVTALQRLNPKFPVVDAPAKDALQQARARLLAE